MNRNYKVIWNNALNCFMAVAEYAKAGGKSSKSSVSSVSAKVWDSTVALDASVLRQSLLRTSLVTVGLIGFTLGMSVQANAAVGVDNGIGLGTAASTSNCTDATQADSGINAENIAIGCSSSTAHGGLKIADRGNPYYTDNITNAALVDEVDRNAYAPRGKDAGSVAIGTGSKTESALGIALGEYATTIEIAGVAIGVGALSQGNTAISIGRQSVATGDYSQAMGNVAAATGKGSLAIGHSTQATGYRAIAIGASDIEKSSESYGQSGASYQSIDQTKASAKDSIALGSGAQSTFEGAVALGQGSTTAIGATSETTMTIGSETYDIAGNVLDGSNNLRTGAQVSVGSVGSERQIKNVAGGRVDANSTDAINGSQLFATNTAVNQGINFGNGTTSNNFALGEAIAVTGDNNLTTVTTNKGVKVKLNKNINLGVDGSVRTGSTLVNDAGVRIVGGSNKTVRLTENGLNNGNNRIKGVAAGIALTDAVNVEQLNAVKNSAVTANKGWDISAQGGNVSTVKPTDTVDFSSKDTNLAVSKDASSHDISFELNKNLVIDSVRTGDSLLDTNGLTITGGPTFTKTKVDVAGNKITSVADGTVAADSKDAVNGGQLHDVVTSIEEGSIVINQKIETNTTNIQNNADKLTAGLNFGADSGDVINKPIGEGSVLSFTGGNNITTTAAGSSIKIDLNGNINVDSVTTGSVTTSSVVAGNTTVNNDGVTLTGGSNQDVVLSNNGLNNGGNKITNVANGESQFDAVNFGQLSDLNKRINNNINDLGYKIGKVEDDANAGISAAMAMSSLPQAYIPGKSMVGGGIATYNGESAVAIGVSTLSSDGRWVIKVNATADTQGNAGGAMGLGFHFD